MNRIEELDKRKVFGTIIGAIIFICCVLFFTYAWYQWSSNNTNVLVTINDPLTECILGPGVNISNIGPVLDYQDGVKVEFNVKNNTGSANTVSVNLNITSISETLLVESFKYILVQDTSGGTDYNYTTPVATGNFSDFEVGTNVIKSSISIAAEKTYSFQLIVYIDGTVYNDTNMMENSMNASLEVGNCGLVAREYVEVNEPNIDDGNLIPVYYDKKEEVWRKADSSNLDNTWYDYANNQWANAVLISDSTTRATYQEIAIGQEVPESVITAFYVWIPRFKYRVWNITRQAGEESTYAYAAYTNGIEIQFEEGTASTGNVECTYNVSSTEGATNLSDTCVYYGTDTITTTSGNKNYTDAWYTHPAFTFGSVEKTGFWIGKFETSGTASAPTVVPDAVALTNQNVSTQFTTSKVFQTYGLSSNMDAHMLTNLEWGAVAYLTHSIYGLCNGSSCRDIYINNSSSMYTGRSGGALSESTSLQLTNFYGSSITTSTDMYNANGYYNYKGYKIDNDGNVTATKDTTKVASTTGNITGVYDMSGGSFEYVMANMVDSTGAFYPASSGTSWNGSTTLASNYYNHYSYGTVSYGQTALNRSRLGDATAEIVSNSTSEFASWRPGTSITGACSTFVAGEKSWLGRGGYYGEIYAGSFHLYYGDGSQYSTTSFRSSLS